MIKKIAIAGLGWLGQPFSRHLQKLGYHVKGSVTSIEKAGVMQRNGIEAFPVGGGWLPSSLLPHDILGLEVEKRWQRKAAEGESEGDDEESWCGTLLGDRGL